MPGKERDGMKETDESAYIVNDKACKGCIYYGHIGTVKCCDYILVTGDVEGKRIHDPVPVKECKLKKTNAHGRRMTTFDKYSEMEKKLREAKKQAEKTNESPEEKAERKKREYREHAMRVYQERTKMGLCPKCGRKNDRENRRYCSACAERDRANNALKKAKMKRSV